MQQKCNQSTRIHQLPSLSFQSARILDDKILLMIYLIIFSKRVAPAEKAFDMSVISRKLQVAYYHSILIIASLLIWGINYAFVLFGFASIYIWPQLTPNVFLEQINPIIDISHTNCSLSTFKKRQATVHILKQTAQNPAQWLIIMQKKQINELVINRLKKQRKDWRSDHPFGFVAKPIESQDGTTNMLKWHCEIPGPKDSPWQNGSFVLTMDFSHDFPVRPPKCVFKPVLPHPNIYPSGTVCLSILNQEEDWKPHITVKQILLGIQKLLKDEPNIESPAQQEPLTLYKNNREEYVKKVKAFTAGCRKKG